MGLHPYRRAIWLPQVEPVSAGFSARVAPLQGALLTVLEAARGLDAAVSAQPRPKRWAIDAAVLPPGWGST